MKKITFFITFFVILNFTISYSQTETVRLYLKLISQGKVEEVKLELPNLLAEFPDDPGVQLLHALVIDDADIAIKIYERIVSKYPKSEWADDAYWRIVQYYAMTGNLEKARAELEKFIKLYPTSEFLAPASDVVRFAEKMMLNKDKERPKSNIDDKTNEPPKKETKVIEPKSKSENKTQIDIKTPNSEKGKVVYCLQVGVYSTEEAAKLERDKYIKQRFAAEIKPKEIDGHKIYAVVIGNYSSRESAESQKALVQQVCKCNPIIIQK